MMAPKKKGSDFDNSDVPKRSHEMLPLSEKVCIYKKKTVCIDLVLSAVSDADNLGTWLLECVLCR